MAANERALTQIEAADRLRISTSWLRTLTDRGVVQRNSDGSYPWPTVGDEYEAYQDSLRDNGASSELEEERIRWTRARADAQERENRKRAGELVPVDEVEALLRESLELVNRELLRAPAKMAPTLAARSGLDEKEARLLLDDIVEEARAHLRALKA